MQINFNSTNFINASQIYCLTRCPTRSWRNGDAQCCQLSNIAVPFSDFFSLYKKRPKPYLVSENRRYCCASERFCSVCWFLKYKTWWIDLCWYFLSTSSTFEQYRYKTDNRNNFGNYNRDEIFIPLHPVVYIYIYIYTHTHTHTHTYIYIYIHTHTHTHTHTYIYIYIYIYIFIYIYRYISNLHRNFDDYGLQIMKTQNSVS